MDRSNRRIETLLGLALLLTAPAAARAEDWPMYGRDLKHSFTNSAALINASNVATLLPAWTFLTGDAVSASPAIVDGVVYVGAWDGFFYALDANTSSPSGAMIWKFQVDCQSDIFPIPAQCPGGPSPTNDRSEEHTSELQSRLHLVCRLLLEKKKKTVH